MFAPPFSCAAFGLTTFMNCPLLFASLTSCSATLRESRNRRFGRWCSTKYLEGSGAEVRFVARSVLPVSLVVFVVVLEIRELVRAGLVAQEAEVGQNGQVVSYFRDETFDVRYLKPRLWNTVDF